MAVHLLLPLLLLLRSISFSSSSSLVGINYGQVADDLPPPSTVLPLLHSLGVARVRLYDADPHVLRALSGTGFDLVVGLPDRCLPSFARDPSAALSWARDHLRPFPSITLVTVGNEVLTSNDSALTSALLPAMESLHSALSSLGLAARVKVTTAHSLGVLSQSFPPSAGAFRRDLIQIINPLLSFLSKTGSLFLINCYPYFAYKADPKRVSLNYVLFEPNDGVIDPGSEIRYDNMLHAQVDAVRSAIAAAGGDAGMEIRVSETGWPSAGDDDEAGATVENARRYNGNLMRMVAEGKGTPARPRDPLRVDVFALFNENLKPGPASERHYGLFKPDGNPAYPLDIAGGSAGNATAIAGDADSPSPPVWSSSSTGYYTISAATDGLRSWAWRVGPAITLGLWIA